ncbi:MAG: hypothetical protein ACD_11C00145G0002 [uncultured bacterium]|nr:MAG: hypothetical protein ACD_11C00145G0002 [uncultured bacterium]
MLMALLMSCLLWWAISCQKKFEKMILSENIAGNPYLQNKVYDYLLDYGDEINTEEHLKLAILEIKK